MEAFWRTLTRRLLALMLLFMGLLAVGAFLFHQLEPWTWIQSFYFSVITLTTVGYGDLVPSNDASRLVVALYALLSIPLLLVSVSMIGEATFQRYFHKMVHEHRRARKR